jgi:hypothetical protein
VSAACPIILVIARDSVSADRPGSAPEGTDALDAAAQELGAAMGERGPGPMARAPWRAGVTASMLSPSTSVNLARELKPKFHKGDCASSIRTYTAMSNIVGGLGPRNHKNAADR